VIGTIVDNELLKRVLEDASVLEKTSEAMMEKPLPIVGPDEPVSRVTRLLADRNAAVLVEDGGEIVGILTRFDMLQFIAGDE
jgi:predicted transcriptional regulator